MDIYKDIDMDIYISAVKRLKYLIAINHINAIVTRD